MTENISNPLKKIGRPYHDLNEPFTVDENGAKAEFIIQSAENLPDLTLGANVVIKDKRDEKIIFIAGRIVGLKAVSPFNPSREGLLYFEDEEADPTTLLEDVTGHHTHQPMIVVVHLDKEMEIMEETLTDYVSLPVQRPPSAMCKMYFPDLVVSQRAENDKTPTLQHILEIKENGVGLGMIGFGNTPYYDSTNNEFLPYKLDLNNLENKHIFVVGESGSGKTVFLKNLAYEIRNYDKDYRIIMTDVQGDIVQLVLHEITDKITAKNWQEKVNYKSSEEIFNVIGKFQVLIPVPDGPLSPNLIALQALLEKYKIDYHFVGLRLQDLSHPSDVEYLFRVTSEQVGLLLDEEAETLLQRRQPVTIDNLKSAIQNITSRNQNAWIPSSGGTTYSRLTYGAALRALETLKEYFDFHQESMTRDRNPLDYLNFNGTTIIYLDELDDDQKIMWEMQLVKWLNAHKHDDWKAFVFFDEAHQIIPAKAPDAGAMGTFNRLRASFENLSRIGRKFGINLVLGTQNPRDLHPIVQEQCSTKVIMKINPSNAGLVHLEPQLAMIANKFSRGQFWIQSPFNGTPNWVRVHSTAPPIPHESMVTFWKKIQAEATK